MGYKIQPKFSLREKVNYKSRGSNTLGEIIEGEIYTIIASLDVEGKHEYMYSLKHPSGNKSGAIFKEDELYKL